MKWIAGKKKLIDSIEQRIDQTNYPKRTVYNQMDVDLTTINKIFNIFC